MSAVVDHAALRAARTSLAALAATLGNARLTLAGQRPDLLAAVDQHAAAVRDSLLGDVRPMTPVALAGYAAGIQEAAGGYGWQPPSDPAGWSPEDWVLTRLVAVCALARAVQ